MAVRSRSRYDLRNAGWDTGISVVASHGRPVLKRDREHNRLHKRSNRHEVDPIYAIHLRCSGEKLRL